MIDRRLVRGTVRSHRDPPTCAYPMKLIVFGANGATGRLLCGQALAEGHTVTAVTRHPDQFPLSHPQLTVLACDALDPRAVERAISGQDAVLSTLGVPYSLKKVSLYSDTMANIVSAMIQQSVRRLVCVSSSGTDPALRSRDTGGGFLFEKVFKPAVIATLGRTLYADLLRMEQLVTASALDWTIVRPGALFDTESVSDYRTAEDVIAGRYTSRADLADCMLRQLDVGTAQRTVIAVATFAEQPSMIGTFWNEALQRVSK